MSIPSAIGRSSSRKLRWRDLYCEAELYKAAVRLYTKPLFSWRKALFASTDKRDFYDFARGGLQNLSRLHSLLTNKKFAFRPCVALHRNFRGKQRTLFIYPWEERIVDLLLYRLLSDRLHSWFSSNSYAYRLRGFGLDRCQKRIASLLSGDAAPHFVVKRDIARYFPSVPHDPLLAQLADLVERDDYLFQLLAQRVRFPFEEDGVLQHADQGIAFGTPTACLLANIYLTPLDRKLDSLPELSYFRYADDLLLLSRSQEVATKGMRTLEESLSDLQLSSKPSHEQNLLLSRTPDHNPDFEYATRFRHLGLEFLAAGGIRLSRDKTRKICNVFRNAFRRKRAKLARIYEYRKRAQLAVETARHALEQSVRNVAVIDYYLKHVTDESQLCLIDRWLAEEVLSIAFRGGHKKKYFQVLPFRALRAMGLPSLVHRRRQILHGQVEAPFFVWKQYQAQKSSRETAASRHSPKAKTAAFSPCSEAVAISSQEVS